jgi:hypothetical protein
MMNPDFKDLWAESNANGVGFLIVGAHALAAHGHIRATKHFDLWIRPSRPTSGAHFKVVGQAECVIDTIHAKIQIHPDEQRSSPHAAP